MLYLNKEVAVVTGRRPFVNKEGYIKHINYCIGIELQKKLSEDREQRIKHQRNDLINVKEENIND